MIGTHLRSAPRRRLLRLARTAAWWGTAPPSGPLSSATLPSESMRRWTRSTTSSLASAMPSATPALYSATLFPRPPPPPPLPPLPPLPLTLSLSAGKLSSVLPGPKRSRAAAS